MPQDKPKKKKQKYTSPVRESIWKAEGRAAATRQKRGAGFDKVKGEKLLMGGGLLGAMRRDERARINKRAKAEVATAAQVRKISQRKK